MSPLGGPVPGRTGFPSGPSGCHVHRPAVTYTVRLSGTVRCARRYLMTALAAMMASPIVASATPMSSAEASL